ncbi:hypothetical protein QCA50_002838 [Cerrena zonata]|uniref:Uncharacterized protein n=1 Tax=Cerrena zonata TaxID=2478898 RepID=A0AAW0GUW0_9APHY
MSSNTSSRLMSSVSSLDYLSASTHSHVHSREGSGGDSSDSSYISVSDEISSDDDEILLSFSEVSSPVRVSSPSPAVSQRAQSPNTFSDDDYVVFGGVKTPEGQFESFTAGGSAVANVESLTETLAQMDIRQGRPRKARSRRFAPQHQQQQDADVFDDAASVRLVSQASSPHRRRKPRRQAAAATTHSSDSDGSTSDASAPLKSSSTPKSKKSKKKKAAASPKSSTKSPSKTSTPNTPKAKRSGLGERPIVDDISEAGDHKNITPGYDEAVQYITSVLADPSPKTNSNLTYLQALIVELGLCPNATFSVIGNVADNLPRSLKAAKTFLKTHAFVNVRDYLAVRHQGLDALKSIMHPNRKSLQKDIRGAKSKVNVRRVPVKDVKESGLGVFLVTCY